jgi:U3 small nucleolar RNA-associated protein 21
MQSAQNRAAWVAFEGEEVRFIYVDVYLERIVTVAGDRVRIWKWYNAKNGMTGGTGNIGLVKMIEEIELEAFIDTAGGKTLVNSEGFILSLDNFTLVLIAKNSEKNWVVARKFKTISPIVDFCISSPDGRFLIASNTDKEITTWDIITGQKIDIFRLPMITTSISCAKDGRFIGMTHVGQKGVSVWVNLNILEQQKFKVWSDDKTVPLKTLPGLSYDAENDVDGEEDFSDLDENSDYESESDSEFGEVSLKYGENSQLTNKQITLSNIPENKWSALPKLDLLKLKNKAINPKKKAALAPFFLETKKMGGGDKNTDDFEFVKSAGGDDDTLDLTQKLTQNSEFLNALESDSFQDLFDLFEKYSASRIDRELRSLVIEEIGNVKASTDNMEEVEETRKTGALRLEQYLSQILGKLKSRMDYEVCNAYLAVFLNVHEDWMLECGSADNEINEVLSQILDVLDDDVDKLSYQFDQSLTILQWLKHSIV